MFGDWLLCDFHIHTTNSDGELTIDGVVNLFGKKGFDVIAVTDHVLDRDSLKRCSRAYENVPAVQEEEFDSYIQKLWMASRKAWDKYNMLLLPGMEITNDTNKYHLLGIDIKRYIDPNLGVENIIQEIHNQGGITVACHPSRRGHIEELQSRHLWDNHDKYAGLFDAWEVANRDDLFNVVGLKKFNYIANSDFHRPRHLYSWKTLLRCEKNPEAIKQAIKENKFVSIYLFRRDKKSPFYTKRILRSNFTNA